MKILRLSAYFFPEVVSSNHLTDDFYSELAKNEISCVCYAPQPTRGISESEHKKYKKYEEFYNGYVKVHRFPMFRENKNPLLRAIRYILCSLVQYFKGSKEKDVDLVYASSTPPTQGMLSALVAKRLGKKYGYKVPFLYNLQDIFPDSLVNAKLTREGSFIWKIGRRIENYTYKHADQIIVLSESMKNNIMEKGVSENKINVISNWVDLEDVKQIKREDNFLINELNFEINDFIVVYAGNFGETQGAEIILEIAKKLEGFKKIKFAIFGGGANFTKFKKDSKNLSNVITSDLLPIKYVSQVYSLGDVALITCKPGTGKAGLPSKTWSIMACNTPIIASFDLDSDLSKLICDSRSGVCVEPGNVEKICENILDIYYKKTSFNRDIRTFVNQNASKGHCLKRYLKLISNTANIK